MAASAHRRPSPVLVVLLVLACGARAADQRLTHLHLYFHEVEAGAPNATVVTVASMHRNDDSSTFGDVNVFDNALREGPDPSSRLIGRAQGVGVHTSLDESGGLTAINFVFSDYGEYSGSSLATLGHFTVSAPPERSIVGGTGRLRFARGYMTSRLISSKGAAIVVAFDMFFTTAL
ncbi:hypothetical protein PR202_ga18675 [Eleusine coracana subsp. coracana]|uniref:Dirigent protein n=1 Tax=Eleusine coracana subsp. coracana TaxID=191504 RepID=A0AAV5CS02_ELECO|nr:hypothetical protein QOZ80_4AG0300300 [Eleusine coracana subsp. coracana]GJN01409.1 hypothetical protein PR202_ga18675 [Eleusine coracana subsp. coracana]